MTDDETVDRIIKSMPARFRYCDDAKEVAEFNVWFDHAEAYRLAFSSDVRERAKMRRENARVRAKVFAALGVHDRRAIEK